MLKRVCLSIHEQRQRFAGDDSCSCSFPFLQGPRGSLTLLSGSHPEEDDSATSLACSMKWNFGGCRSNSPAQELRCPEAHTAVTLETPPLRDGEGCETQLRGEICLQSGASAVLRHSKPRGGEGASGRGAKQMSITWEGAVPSHQCKCSTQDVP